jgi:hypothetical protein
MHKRTAKVAVFAAIQVIVAIGTALLLPLTLSRGYPPSSQIIISALAATIILVAPVPILLRQAAIDQQDLAKFVSGERVHLASLDIVTTDLLRVQTALPHVQNVDPGNLFVPLLMEELSTLADRVEGCARQRRLEVLPSYRTTDPLLRALNTSESGECEFFHYADNHRFFFEHGGHSLDFNEKLHQAIQNSHNGMIYRLIVVSNQEEAEATETWLMGLFHRDSPTYDYGIISRSTLDVKRTELQIRPSRVDVGIYGHRYAYISEQAPDAPNEAHRMQPSGLISSEPTEVANYRRLFMEAWKSARRLPTGPLNALAVWLTTSTGSRGSGSAMRLNSYDKLQRVVERPLPNMLEVLAKNDSALNEFDNFVRYFGNTRARR